jgi:V/A-type H+/Na+-transporting ATPase subunit I
VFLIGIILSILGEPFMLFGLIAIILSVIMQIGFKFLEGGPVIGMLSIFDFSGFVGDTFSYARLTALAIGTAGIALAVNFMALLVFDMVPVLGFPLAIIVFLVGHLFNMVMNGLGAFIHSLRLHFLEFFQKFYEGGGTQYKPFYAIRKKTFGGE